MDFLRTKEYNTPTMASPDRRPEMQPRTYTRRFVIPRLAFVPTAFLAACGANAEAPANSAPTIATKPTLAAFTPNTEIDVKEYVRLENASKIKTLNPNIKEENERVGGLWITPEEPKKQLDTNRLTIAARSILAKGELGNGGIVFTGDALGLDSSNPERSTAWHIFAWRQQMDADGRFRGAYSVTVDLAELGVPPENKVDLSFDVLAKARPELDGENVLYVRKASPNGPHQVTTPK